jgi:hypothetical protein
MPKDSFTGKMRRGKVWPHLHALHEKYRTLLGALADKRLRVDLRDPSKVMAAIWVLGDWWRALGKDRQLGISPRRCRSAPCVQRRVPRELPPFAAHARNKIQSLAGVKSPLKCIVLCLDRKGTEATKFKPCAADRFRRGAEGRQRYWKYQE